MKTLLLVSGLGDRPRDRDLERAGREPRLTLFNDRLGCDTLNRAAVRGLPGIRGAFYRLLPVPAAQAVEAWFRRRNYDAVISWADDIALAHAAVKLLTFSRHPHVAMMTWLSKPKKALPFRMVHAGIDRLLLWSTVQHDAALRLGASPATVALLGRRADTTFWRPVAGPTDTVCSAGREMRDFPTLVEAMRDTGIPCHIATGVYPDGRLFETVKNLYRVGDLPANVTVCSMTREELRALYGRSRFVVVPLHPTDTDNGATTIEEAMAMGKAVVCSRTAGQVDLVREGETGIMVPPHDAAALRAAIVRLWENPAEAARMGANARALAEERHSLDRFVDDVERVVREAVLEARAGRQRLRSG